MNKGVDPKEWEKLETVEPLTLPIRPGDFA